MTADISVLHISYFITLIALTIREILWLRIVLTISQLGHLSHSYMNLDSNKGFWIIIFIIINIMQIIIIYRDRQKLAIPDEIRDLYENIFHIKSNREFLHFWDQGIIHHAHDKTLISIGDTQADLMMILNGKAEVMRDGKHIATLGRSQFIAEISYITGKPASADVVSKEDLTYYVWNRNTLDKLRKTKPDTMNKLDRILTLDMAEKLTR